LKYGISVDDELPQIISINKTITIQEPGNNGWQIISLSNHQTIQSQGRESM